MKKYIPSAIEPKWQKKWAKDKLYEVDLTEFEKRQYILIEFSYPSGDLHMGHWFAFAVPDIYARAKRMQGYQVFFPNGFDAFGLPAENAAIKKGIHPKDWTLANIKKMERQFMTMGASFSWENEVITCLPEYYKWNQWIFLKMLERGIAYKGKALANWCPNCQTVLANENVEAGKCWRCGTEVIQKEVEQWFLKLTAYADRLLWKEAEGPEQSRRVDWPKPVRVGQNNWIGKSEGVTFKYKVKDLDIHFEMYDSVPQTFMAQTFTVIAPEHPAVMELVKGTDYEKPVLEFMDKIKKRKAANKFQVDKEVEGIFTGRYVQYTSTGKLIPIWLASFVIHEYGTGVVNASAHDERDFAFAKKYGLELHPVMFPKDPKEAQKVKNLEYCYHHAEEGILEEPTEFKGRKWGEVRSDIIDFIEKKGYGKRKTQYHIHDWSISRQRYWGTPIPIIYCEGCGTVPVPEKDLPVELPYNVDYAPKGKPPLATAEDWVNVACPKCGGSARREVETMDTFFDSSWYFFRYLDPKNDKEPFDKLRVKDWLPLDIYFGGAEHTLGHTLYSRFFTKFFQDLGLISFDEYAKKRINHGLILGPDGQKMSKSRGNVVNPDEQVKKYGADAVRLYMAFIGPYAETVAPWDNAGLNGVYHFLQRIWGLQEKMTQSVILSPKDEGSLTNVSSNELRDSSLITQNDNNADLRMMHRTIKKVTEDLNNIKFNTAIASLMEWLNYLSAKEKVEIAEYKTLLLLLAPFAPHITEELWQNIRFFEMGGEKWDLEVKSLEFKESRNQDQKYLTSNVKNSRLVSIHSLPWPKFDDKYLQEEEIKVVVQINGKVRDILLIHKDIISSKKDIEKKVLESTKVKKFITGKSVKKIVYITGKIISLVVSN